MSDAADSPVVTVRAAAVLFDSDGVLVDSADSLRRCTAQWATSHGLDPDHAFRRWHGRRAIDVIAELLPDADHEAEDAAYEDVEVADAPTVTAIPGAIELVSTPGLLWAVVTGCSQRLAKARLGAAGIPTPPVLVAGDQIASGKPAPDGYLAAASRLGVDTGGCVVVEDADAGIIAGLDAGCLVVAHGDQVTIEDPRVTRVDDLRRIRIAPSPIGTIATVRIGPAAP